MIIVCETFLGVRIQQDIMPRPSRAREDDDEAEQKSAELHVPRNAGDIQSIPQRHFLYCYIFGHHIKKYVEQTQSFAHIPFSTS